MLVTKNPGLFVQAGASNHLISDVAFLIPKHKKFMLVIINDLSVISGKEFDLIPVQKSGIYPFSKFFQSFLKIVLIH